MALPMVCGNPDRVVHIEGVECKASGAYAQYYEEQGGKVIYFGKPFADIYQAAYEKLGAPEKSRLVAVGDALFTDIQGANLFGIDSLFNLTGIHWADLRK